MGDDKTAQTTRDEMEEAGQISTDFTIPDQNKCYVDSVFSFVHLFPPCSRNEVSTDFHFGSKAGFSNNFFRGGPDIFSALNKVFLAKINN